MSKGHRDNVRARKKRPGAYEKRTNRRAAGGRRPCNLCGTRTRVAKLDGGLCPRCQAL